MGNNIKKRVVVGDRPATIPVGWIVCNAPRPIFGHVLWMGEFVTGRFYAAIDPEEPNADQLYALNCQNDATILGFINEDAAFERGREIIRERHGASAEVEAIVGEPANRSWVVSHCIAAMEQALLEFLIT